MIIGDYCWFGYCIIRLFHTFTVAKETVGILTSRTFGLIVWTLAVIGNTVLKFRVSFFFYQNTQINKNLDCQSRCQTIGYNNEGGYNGGNNPGWDYTGNVAVTVSGKKCQFWNKLTFSHSQPAYNHNYCRNPDSADGGVWCYTDIWRNDWEYCSQIKCSLFIFVTWI